MTKKSLFRKLNGFSEDFAPAYYEDVDYCVRIKQLGYKNIYFTDNLFFKFNDINRFGWYRYER